MKSLLLVGGARSGKSSLAERAAADASRGRPVTVYVTAVATDDEMTARIARHQRDRPPTWTTVEAPFDLDEVVAAASDDDQAILVDCVTVWLANLLVRGDTPAAIEARGSQLATAIRARQSPTVVVTNEVGMGIVPIETLGREFRDVQGRVNQTLATAVDRAVLVVAGQALPLHGASDLWQRLDS